MPRWLITSAIEDAKESIFLVFLKLRLRLAFLRLLLRLLGCRAVARFGSAFWLERGQDGKSPRIKHEAGWVVFAAQDHDFDDAEVVEDVLIDSRLRLVLDLVMLASHRQLHNVRALTNIHLLEHPSTRDDAPILQQILLHA